MHVFDRLLLVICAVGVTVLWFEGYHHAADARERDEGALAASRSILSAGGAEGGSLTDLGLPAGLRIDPATGLLVGVVPPDMPGCKPLTWEVLRTYEYRPALEGMPDSIKVFDGEKVVMIGFLMTVFEFDDIHEFHLVSNHWSCCYGVPPGLEGAVHVKLAAGQEGLPNTIKPVRVVGTLRIGEVKESEIVYAIYSIDDAEVVILDY